MGRYYNLDVVAGAGHGKIDPRGEWEAMESRVEDPIPYLGNLERLHRDYYPRVNSALVARMERLVRAIAMQFTLGGMPTPEVKSDGSQSYTRSSGTSGTTNSALSTIAVRWRSSGATPTGGSGAPIRRVAASGWPSRAVGKAEFGDEWPFRDDRVTVECRDGLFCIVNIGGYDFALNGAARSRFGLPFAPRRGRGGAREVRGAVHCHGTRAAGVTEGGSLCLTGLLQPDHLLLCPTVRVVVGPIGRCRGIKCAMCP